MATRSAKTVSVISHQSSVIRYPKPGGLRQGRHPKADQETARSEARTAKSLSRT